MNILKQYIDYIKDNPRHYWFKRKMYGWGWVPVTWQGWLLIVIFLAYILWNSMVLDFYPNPTNGQITWFFVKTIIAVAVLIFICYKKGEKPKWQWGKPSNKE